MATTYSPSSPAWLNTLGSIGETAGNIYAAVKGTDTKTQIAQTQAVEAKAGSKNILMIAGLALVAILALVFVLRKK